MIMRATTLLQTRSARADKPHGASAIVALGCNCEFADIGLSCYRS